jgi:glutathione S-transferase
MTKCEHKTSEFLKKDPSGKIPVLELEDGRCPSESVAIFRYIEEVHPEPNLMGPDPFEVGHIEMRNRHIETEFWSQVGVSWVNGSIVGAMRIYKQIPEAKVANVAKYCERLEAELATAP